MAHFNGGLSYATFGLSLNHDDFWLKYETDGKTIESVPLPKYLKNIWLRSTAGFDDLSHYTYSTDGENFMALTHAYQLRPSNYRGAMVGIFTYNHKGDAGYVDVDYFRYTVDH